MLNLATYLCSRATASPKCDHERQKVLFSGMAPSCPCQLFPVCKPLFPLLRIVSPVCERCPEVSVEYLCSQAVHEPACSVPHLPPRALP